MSDTTTNTQTIKYEKIVNRDISNLLKTGTNTSNAENNLANNQGKLWGNLLGSLEMAMDWAKLEEIGSSTDGQKAVRKVLQDHLKREILKESNLSLDTDAKGKVLWSKDKHTRPIMKYTSDIAKVVACGMASDLLPNDGTYAARCDILKACQGSKSALELIKLAITQIDSAMEKATPAEYSDIMDCFQTLSVHIAKVQS